MNKEFFDREDVIFSIAKHIAEEDSIGEGYGYCSKYTKNMFDSPSGEVEEEYKSSAQNLAQTLKGMFIGSE